MTTQHFGKRNSPDTWGRERKVGLDHEGSYRSGKGRSYPVGQEDFCKQGNKVMSALF
jgi:hypothetical protein